MCRRGRRRGWGEGGEEAFWDASEKLVTALPLQLERPLVTWVTWMTMTKAGSSCRCEEW